MQSTLYPIYLSMYFLISFVFIEIWILYQKYLIYSFNVWKYHSSKSLHKFILNVMKEKVGSFLKYPHFMIFLRFKRGDYWIYQIELFHKISPFEFLEDLKQITNTCLLILAKFCTFELIMTKLKLRMKGTTIFFLSK